MIDTLMICLTFWTNMLQRLLAVLPRSQWISDTYKNAKSIRRQFERIWHKKKTPLNHAKLRKQMARCNSLANKDKATYYRALVNKNGDDPKKLWKVLRSALHCIPDKVLPSNSSQKKLAEQFATFFTNKIAKIRVFFQFFIFFLAISSESARTCQI